MAVFFLVNHSPLAQVRERRCGGRRVNHENVRRRRTVRVFPRTRGGARSKMSDCLRYEPPRRRAARSPVAHDTPPPACLATRGEDRRRGATRLHAHAFEQRSRVRKVRPVRVRIPWPFRDGELSRADGQRRGSLPTSAVSRDATTPAPCAVTLAVDERRGRDVARSRRRHIETGGAIAGPFAARWGLPPLASNAPPRRGRRASGRGGSSRSTRRGLFAFPRRAPPSLETRKRRAAVAASRPSRLRRLSPTRCSFAGVKRAPGGPGHFRPPLGGRAGRGCAHEPRRRQNRPRASRRPRRRPPPRRASARAAWT